MSYRTSKARRQLQAVYSDINKRLKASENTQLDSQLREYVVAASIFLAFAEIENYVEDLFSAFSTCLHANIAKGSDLPPNIRSHLFLSKSNATSIFSNFLSSNSEKELFKSFSNALESHSGAFVNDAAQIKPFTGKDLYTTIKYPSEKNLERLFIRVGVDKVFNALSAHLGEDAKALLQSISSLRTQLAHTGTLPGVSAKDVKARLVATEKFVGAMDRVMYNVTSTHFGSSKWKAHLC